MPSSSKNVFHFIREREREPRAYKTSACSNRKVTSPHVKEKKTFKGEHILLPGPDVDILVLGSPHAGSLVELDAVRVATVPDLDHLAWLPTGSHARLHEVADLEPQHLLLHLARHHASLELLHVQVAADEDEAALARLVLPPADRREASAEEHADSLEDELPFHPLAGEDALVPEEVGALGHDQLADELLQGLGQELALELDGAARDAVVVLVLRVHVGEKVGLKLEDARDVEGPHPEELVPVDLAVRRPHDGRVGVDVPDALLDLLELLLLLDQVDLVQQDDVRERELLLGLVLDALRFLVVQPQDEVLGVHHGDDGVQLVQLLDLRVDQEGLRDRRRVGQASGLDDHAVELGDLGVEPLEGLHEVPPHRAADAPVHHLDHLLVDVLLELVVPAEDLLIDSNLPELVLDDGEPQPMVLGKQVVQQGRLPGSEEPGQHRHRHLAVRKVLVLPDRRLLGRRVCSHVAVVVPE
mmetsp:Transcript_6917/g.20216  ORF Transcript_6917/g.20216 Transcript_6917/m.20216 type:complete len:471 (-) Transcript_6917:65-1477(-)